MSEPWSGSVSAKTPVRANDRPGRLHQVERDQVRQHLRRKLAALPVLVEHRADVGVEDAAQPGQHRALGVAEQVGEPVLVAGPEVSRGREGGGHRQLLGRVGRAGGQVPSA
jgi:hypothetical protein